MLPQVITLLALFCYVVFAGQVGSNLAAVTTAPRSLIAQIIIKNPGAPTPTPTTAQPVNFQPATQLKDYPPILTSTGVGPHNNNRLSYTPRLFNAQGKKALLCQLDCKSLFKNSVDSVRATIPVFSQCKNRYYSYGSYKRFGCIPPGSATPAQISLAVSICVAYNGCVEALRAMVSSSFSSLSSPVWKTASGSNANKSGTISKSPTGRASNSIARKR